MGNKKHFQRRLFFEELCLQQQEWFKKGKKQMSREKKNLSKCNIKL